MQNKTLCSSSHRTNVINVSTACHAQLKKKSNNWSGFFWVAVADPGFSPGGAPTPKSAIIFQFFAETDENERIWTPRGGARPWRPPLDPPMGW